VTPELASLDAGIVIGVIVLALLLAGAVIGVCRLLGEHREPAAGDGPADAAATLAGIDEALNTLHGEGWRL